MMGLFDKPVTGKSLMNKPIGGRGKKAPYQTKSKRIPIALEQEIDAIIETYRSLVIDGIEPSQPNNVLSLDDAKQLAKNLVKAKGAKLDVAIKLVTGIYGVEITKEDLS
jgi:hypothetical protein